MKKSLLLALLLVPLIYIYFYADSELFAEFITGRISSEQELADEGNIEVYFCPQDNCESSFVNFLDSAQESIHCALFEVDLQSVQDKLIEKSKSLDVKIVTDDGYYDEFNRPFVKKDSYGLMHNKFCVIDGKKISAGSMNPTFNCANKNNNNLLLIESKLLAENYEDEFQEMWGGRFKTGSKVARPEISLSGIKIKNYFCPEDDCAYQIKEELKKAEKSIYFMAFSFTHEGIANILLLENLNGVEVKGVMEARQVSEYSQFERLFNNGIDVVKDKNKGNMHHKAFIIDEETVITGSFNPTENGDTKNDENVLVIEDKEIAAQFLDEFNRVLERDQ